MKKKVGIIVGSTRQNRKSIIVAKWVQSILTTMDSNFDYKLIDLNDFSLPFYNEPSSPRSSQEYQHETTKQWSSSIQEIDVFIFVTPEYNGMITGALKNAIDLLYYEWAKKPYCIVGYGSKGAKRAQDNLHTLLSAFSMIHLECDLSISKIWDAVIEGQIDVSYMEGSFESIILSLSKFFVVEEKS